MKIQPRFYVFLAIVIGAILLFVFKDKLINMSTPEKASTGKPAQEWTYTPPVKESAASDVKAVQSTPPVVEKPVPVEVIEPIVPEKKVEKSKPKPAPKKAVENSKPKPKPKKEESVVKEKAPVKQEAPKVAPSPAPVEDDEAPAIYKL